MARLETPVQFGETLRLEGRLALVEGAKAMVVYSHPYPPMGGDMDNGVVRLGCHHLNRLGYSTLRYNFRGVGQSDGAFDEGRGETDDLLSALAYARQQSRLPIMLAGYSFGAYVTWRALKRVEGIHAVALVSPAFLLREAVFSPRPDHPPLFAAVGDQDPFCPVETFHQQMDRLAPEAERYIKAGMDHFWINHIDELTRRIGAFFWTTLDES